MNVVLRCSCGANLRIPPEAQGKQVRCPHCRADLHASTQPLPIEHAMPGGGAFGADDSVVGQTCPICLTAIARGEAVHQCPQCDLVHHEECWAEVGGCGTFGCKQAPAADKNEQSPQAPLTAWGDTKDCPVCGETIKSIALKCRYCGASFDTVDPLTAADLKSMAAEGQRLASIKQSVIALFVVSLLGCAAPLTALIAAIYIPSKRVQLAKCGPLYKIMGWTSLALSCFYSLLMLLFILSS